MKRIFLPVFLLAVLFLSGVVPAFAQSGPVDVYVDTSRPGANEDGSQTNPYNTEKEGKAYAQSQTGGGWVYVKNTATGTWTKTYIPPVKSAPTGEPIPSFVLYTILGILAILLILAGQYLLKKSRQTQA